jgi:hypothetical protein
MINKNKVNTHSNNKDSSLNKKYFIFTREIKRIFESNQKKQQ